MDFISEVQLPDEALYGINAYRAASNFPDSTRFPFEWYCSMGLVKKSCYLTYKKFVAGVKVKYTDHTLPFYFMDTDIVDVLTQAATEISEGKHFEHFIVPAIQGGAGTSINLNVNEIVTNRALQLMGRLPGDYAFIHPIEHANIFQSTNDVIPTSLKICLMGLFKKLEFAIKELRLSVESLESNSRNHVRIAYTEMQEAVPSTYGRLFSTYSDALSRDWWRVSKCSERIKTVNLGGSAIGTGITVPAYFIHEVVQTLRDISGLPVARAENLSDATSNLDSLVEIHATIKAHAVNLEKMVSDIRLLASDLMKNRELFIPQIQIGSSIMPGKVNPVIPEFVVSACHKIYANDQLISSLCGQGCLELNAYIPVIGYALIESIKLMQACNETLRKNLISGITLNGQHAMQNLLKNPVISTALVPYIGYAKAGLLAAKMKEENIDLFAANSILGMVAEDKLERIVSPDNLLKEGFSFNDVLL